MFVKTVFFAPSKDTDKQASWNTRLAYMPLSSALSIRCTTSDRWITRCHPDNNVDWTAFEFDYADSEREKTLIELHNVLNECITDKEHMCDDTNAACAFTVLDNVPCNIMKHLFPLYTILAHETSNNDMKFIGWFVVHPDERDRMERILAGTNDPIHDLVHELRYNPALALGADVSDARDNFNKRIRKE